MELVPSNNRLSAFEQLPKEIIARIFAFTDIVTRIQRASSLSRHLRKIILESKELWTVIDFDTEFPRSGLDLTDYILARVLALVNARKVTKKLSLRDCYRVRGSGLKPLRGSRVLETVDLQRDRDWDEKHALKVLNTMIPFKLREVKFEPLNRFDAIRHPPVIRFLHALRKHQQLQALEEGTLCSACHDPVVDEKRQLVPYFTGLPLTRCSFCLDSYCARGSCSMDFVECRKCGVATCDKCNFSIVPYCDDCNQAFCNDCHGDECDSCQKRFCNDCNFVDYCFECEKRLCRRCAREDNYWAARTCTECGCASCDDCADCDSSVKLCSLCCYEFCTSCREINYVDCCSCDVCTDCKNTVYCQVCERHNCEGCVTIQHCASCGKAACESCYFLGKCVDCNEKPTKKAKRNEEI